MTYKSITLAIVIALAASTGALAQIPAPTIGTSTDELCTMTNGNRIPCVFLESAEKDVSTSGKVVDQVSGIEFCKSSGKYAPCDSLNTDGSLTLTYKFRQYASLAVVALLRHWQYVLVVVIALTGAVVLIRKFIKK